jgi:predicted ATPase
MLSNLSRLSKKQKLLVFSLDSNYSWESYVEKIQWDTDIGDNLVAIFVEKIDTLTPEVRVALIVIGSCLGSEFDMLVVESLLTTINHLSVGNIAGRDQLMNALEVASKEGGLMLARHRGSSLYRFVHNKIHQAFYSLFPEIAKADELHLKIGRALLVSWKGGGNRGRIC